MDVWQTWHRIQSYLQPEVPVRVALPLEAAIDEARREWQDAQLLYDAVVDGDLIDYAVYLLQAAEKKYMYLLKQARQQGVAVSPLKVLQQKQGRHHITH